MDRTATTRRRRALNALNSFGLASLLGCGGSSDTDALSSTYNANAGYSASVRNLAAISLALDNVFSDGAKLEMTTLQAHAKGGYAASINVSIAA